MLVYELQWVEVIKIKFAADVCSLTMYEKSSLTSGIVSAAWGSSMANHKTSSKLLLYQQYEII